MSNWKIIFDNNTTTLTTDEPTDEGCWEFWHSSPTVRGYGVVASTREICLKKLLKCYSKELKEKEKELNKLKRFFRKVEKELK